MRGGVVLSRSVCPPAATTALSVVWSQPDSRRRANRTTVVVQMGIPKNYRAAVSRAVESLKQQSLLVFANQSTTSPSA